MLINFGFCPTVRRQESGEPISEFAADLRKLAKSCKYGDSLDRTLRDQFVIGLNSSNIRERIFAKDEKLTFAEAVEMAVTSELASKRSRAIEAGRGVQKVAAISARSRSAHGIDMNSFSLVCC